MPSPPKLEQTAEWLTIRLHKEPKNDEYRLFCENQFDSYISCYETHSNRPHVHILCKIRVARSVYISEYLKKMFKISGNTDFSVKNVNPTEEDLHEVAKYTCKGDSKKQLPCVVFCSPDWTPDIIKKYHDEYHKIKHITDIYQEAPVKIDLNTMEQPENIVKKIPRKPWLHKVLDELEEERPDWRPDWHSELDKQFMIKYLLHKLGETRKIFDEYQIKKFVYGAFNYLDAQHFKDDMTAKIYKII